MSYDSDNNSNQLRIINEVLNDVFWLAYLLEIKKGINDDNQKQILGSLLVLLTPIFAEAVIDAGIGGLSGKRTITLHQIEALRMQTLKQRVLETSRTTKKKSQEMGIDFNSYIFDLVLHISNSELIDINFRHWDYQKETTIDQLDGIMASPLAWAQTLIPEIFDRFLSNISKQTEIYIDRINQKRIEQKSYSSRSLFKKSVISNIDKYYILQRYGLIKTILLMNEIMPENIVLTIGDIKFDFQHFILKAKAIVIEMIWQDSQGNVLTVIDEAFRKNSETVDEEFYSINRACRNNLHYKTTNQLSESDKEILLRNQDKYLENILEVFDAEISFRFGKTYSILMKLAKLSSKV